MSREELKYVGGAKSALEPYAPLTPGIVSEQLSATDLDNPDPTFALSEEDTQRLHRLFSVLDRATVVHKSPRQAAIWCLQELPALGRQTPIQKCQTEEGYRRVLGLLGQIEHGVFG